MTTATGTGVRAMTSSLMVTAVTATDNSGSRQQWQRAIVTRKGNGSSDYDKGRDSRKDSNGSDSSKGVNAAKASTEQGN